MKNEYEKAYPWPSTSDKDGEYSFLRTECGNSWYSVKTDPMLRNGCICPKCGKIVRVIMPNVGDRKEE
jgi:ribosomal protein S27AE